MTNPTMSRLASTDIPIRDTWMRLTVFGWRVDSGDRDRTAEVEEAVALRTLPRPDPPDGASRSVPARSNGARQANSAAPAPEPPLVRIHSACFTGDVLDSTKCDCGPQLRAALDAIIQSADGLLLYLLRQEGRGIGLANKIRAYALQAAGHDTVTANLALGLPVEARDFGIAAECLRLLGLRRIRLMTNNPLKISAMDEHGIEVTERLPLGGFRTAHNAHYLRTKDRVMGHLGALQGGETTCSQ
ncbi:MAG TPA: GTP cyclohydrolase II RibA [Micromonosporaceae bacterium]